MFCVLRREKGNHFRASAAVAFQRGKGATEMRNCHLVGCIPSRPSDCVLFFQSFMAQLKFIDFFFLNVKFYFSCHNEEWHVFRIGRCHL